MGDSRPTLELANLQNNSVTVVGAVAENPPVTLFGTARSNVPARMLTVDGSGNGYAITVSGLSVIPLTAQGAPAPQIAAGAGAIVNGTSGGTTFAPGSFIVVNGSNLAASGKATQLPAPTILGGSCLTVGNLAIPLYKLPRAKSRRNCRRAFVRGCTRRRFVRSPLARRVSPSYLQWGHSHAGFSYMRNHSRPGSGFLNQGLDLCSCGDYRRLSIRSGSGWRARKDFYTVVNSPQNRIEVYNIAKKQLLTPIPTSGLPISAALSADGQSLYVADYGASTLDIVNLTSLTTTSRVSLASAPEGVAVGGDGRVLITTSGTTTSTGNLLLYDPTSGNVSAVAVAPPAPTAPGTSTTGKVFTNSRSHLEAVARWQSHHRAESSERHNFRSIRFPKWHREACCEAAASLSISSVLSVSSDSSRFMAGLTLFDSASLNVIAQQCGRFRSTCFRPMSISILRPTGAAAYFHRMAPCFTRHSIHSARANSGNRSERKGEFVCW